MRLVIIGAGFAGMVLPRLSAARLREYQGATSPRRRLEIALVAPQPTLVVVRPRLYESKAGGRLTRRRCWMSSRAIGRRLRTGRQRAEMGRYQGACRGSKSRSPGGKAKKESSPTIA